MTNTPKSASISMASNPCLPPEQEPPVVAGMRIDCALKVICCLYGTNLIGMDVVSGARLRSC